MRNPDFPNWKHILIMAAIYFAGSLAAAVPLTIIMIVNMVSGGGEIDMDAMADPMRAIDPIWLSHLAPLMHGLPLVLAGLYGWQRLGKPKWRLGFDKVSLGAGILATIGTLLIANGSTMVAEFLPGYESFVKAMEEMLVPGVGMAIAVVLGAPIFEEAVFRGVILRGYLRKIEPWKGIVFSGLLFGALHILPVHVFFASIVGIALGYVYYRTRSLGLVILIHLINNGASYLASQMDVPTSTTEMIGWEMPGILALAAVLTAAGVGLLYLMGQRYALVPAPAEDLLPEPEFNETVA